MAYIYRYHLRNSALRESIILTRYKQDIEDVLSKHFNENLKDKFVEQNFFEFKLFATVSRKTLQKMGRKLKDKLSFGGDKYGFIRMEQTLYALVSALHENLEDNSSEDIIHIEFIDSMLLDNRELYMHRANYFFESLSSTDLLHEKGYINLEEIIKNNYLDILDAYIDKKAIPNQLKSKKGKSCFYVKGFHKHNEKERSSGEKYVNDSMIPLEICYDAGYVKNRDHIIGEGSNRINRDFSFDYIKIYSSEERPEHVGIIENELKLSLPVTSEISTLNNIIKNHDSKPESKCVFRVHNVGQALATSLAYENQPPFLYFDYGMPFGENSFTRPTSVNMPTSSQTTIVISHVDKDHWFRIADDFNAYKCNWFIPNQLIKKGLRHKLAEIIVHGGTVNLINSDIIFHGGRITCGGTSRRRPSRPACNVHETGLSLRLEAHDDKGNILNILIAGDQRYDYIDLAQLNDLDILVASHHGGAYCWSTQRYVPPARSDSSVVVYSYGMNNTHSHPSNTADYSAANWMQEYHTSIDNDFTIMILF